MSYLAPLCLSFLICLMGRYNSIYHLGSFCGFNKVNTWEVLATLPGSNNCSINTSYFPYKPPFFLSTILKFVLKSCENQQFPKVWHQNSFGSKRWPDLRLFIILSNPPHVNPHSYVSNQCVWLRDAIKYMAYKSHYFSKIQKFLYFETMVTLHDNSVRWVLLITAFYWCGSWESKSLCALPRAPQPGSGRVRFWMQVDWFQGFCLGGNFFFSFFE